MTPNSSLLDRLAAITRGPDAEADVRLARGAASSFVFKLVYSGLAFLGGLLLARWLGTAGYGAYAYAMAWIWFLVPLASLGLDALLVREMAAYRVQSAWGEMRAFLPADAPGGAMRFCRPGARRGRSGPAFRVPR